MRQNNCFRLTPTFEKGDCYLHHGFTFFCLSVCLYQLGSQFASYWKLTLKSVEKIGIFFYTLTNISGILNEDLCLIDAGVMKSPTKRRLSVKWYQALKIDEEV